MRSYLVILLSLIAVALLATACGPSKAQKLNKEGNDAFAQQAFQEALVAYQAAQIQEPELAEPYYNAANALYRQGAYADALEQMQKALSFAGEESLAQAGHYNLGNSSYNQQDLQSAVASYTQALLLNPDDQDAKYNLELALQQLQQQQQNQEQQEQEQQEQEQQDESQGGEGQQEEQDQSGEQQQEQDQSGQGQEEEQQSQPEEGQQQDQQSEEASQGEESQEEQQQDQQGEQQEEQGQQGQEQAQEGQPDQPQQEPLQQGQLNQMPAPGQRMTEEQAKQLLAAIAREGQTLQEKLGQIFAVPWVPPVQDW